ncbi:MAG TPA: hypothetical protein VK797_23270 [Tepidisphaeraceae bacterium]|jgi:hypothetical protein|nr:hypothetical protein [Tepidisphaeraceae bacterium]
MFRPSYHALLRSSLDTVLWLGVWAVIILTYLSVFAWFGRAMVNASPATKELLP